jgi:hypothetical protein
MAATGGEGEPAAADKSAPGKEQGPKRGKAAGLDVV